MPHFFEKPYYAGIVAVLRAGDNIDARVRENGQTYSVEVKLEDGSIILWTNQHHNGHWAYSILHTTESPDLDLSESEQTLEEITAAAIAPMSASADDNEEVVTMYPHDLTPEEAAVMIATEPYPGTVDSTTSDGS